MKKIIITALMIALWFTGGQVPVPSYAPPTYTKQITMVGCGEYQTNVLNSDSTVSALFYEGGYVWANYSLPDKVISLVGGQYDGMALLKNGGVITGLRKGNDGSPNFVTVPVDAYGNAFTGNTYIHGNWQTYLSIRHDSIDYWGAGNNLTYGSLGLNGGANIPAPITLGQPPGRKVDKLVTMDNASGGMALIMARCTDGTVWNYFYGSANPTQQTGFTGPALDIAGITRACYIIVTATDMLAYGPFTEFVGLATNTTAPTSIRAKFDAAGAVWPYKKVVSNYNTLHIIDAVNHMYGIGDDVMGEIGDGIQWPSWATYTFNGGPSPFAWSFLRGQLLRGVTRIPGEWADMWSGENIAFFFYAKDMYGNVYDWGRDKQTALFSGRRAANDDSYNCAIDNPAPTFVNPASMIPQADFTFDPTMTFKPFANAGQKHRLITTTTDSLYGSGSSQPEGTISAYAWRIISGSGSIAVSSHANTLVSNVSDGATFELTVTGTSGITSKDTTTFSVNLGIKNYLSFPVRFNLH